MKASTAAGASPHGPGTPPKSPRLLTHSTNPMYVYTKTVVAAARATTAAAAAMMASTSKNVTELQSLQVMTASLVSPRSGRDNTAPQRPFTSSNISSGMHARSPFASPRDREPHTSATLRDHHKGDTSRKPGLPLVASPHTSGKLVQFASKDWRRE